MTTLRRPWLPLLLLLASGLAAAAPASQREIYEETRAQAEAGDTDAMRRMIEGRAQVKYGAFGRRSYVPFMFTGTVPGNEYKHYWQPTHAEHVTWIRRAAAAGADDLQRVLVLCHQFGCETCTKNNNRKQCSVEHRIERDPAQARQLAQEFRAASAKPAHWDSLQGLLEEWATLEPRAQRYDTAAAARLAELAGQAYKLAAPVPAPHVQVYFPLSSGSQLELQNTHWQQHWLQAAARGGDQGSREQIDPAARQAGMAQRWNTRVQDALRQEAQQRRQLLGAGQAR